MLAAIMTFVTTYALILPAITVERENTEEVAGMYLEREEGQNDLLVENALEPAGTDILADGSNEQFDEDADIPDYDASLEENSPAGFEESDGEEAASAVKTLKAIGNDYTVNLTYDVTSGIPEDADLIVSEIAQDSETYQTYLKETKKAMGLAEEETLPHYAARFFDIKIMIGEDEFTPESGVAVEITYAEPLAEKAEAEVSAVHFAYETAEAEVIEANATEVQADGAATVEFTAESFSVYGVIYTVDFHWEVDGKTYEFSIPGGGFMSFTDLLDLLGITGKDVDKEYQGDAVSGSAREFASNVDMVEFSSPELVDVSKVYADTTVGAIIADRALSIEYSDNLTDEQIAEINSTEVQAGDWAIISLMPFTSEESLTVTMKNGKQFVVRVTDRQLGPNDRANVTVPNLKDFVTLDMFNYGPSSSLDSMYNSYDHGHTVSSDGINSYSNLKFVGYGSTAAEGGVGFNAFTGGTSIYQDIVKRKLVGDYPQLNDTSSKSLSYLFDRTPLGNNNSAKSVTSDVQGLFYKANYDGSGNRNGAYYAYDSDRYYAYLNGSNVELYNTYKFNSQNYYGGNGIDPSVNGDGLSNKAIGFFPYTKPDDSNVCPHPSDVNWHNNWHNELRGKYDHQFGLTMSAQFEMPLKDANGQQTVDGNHMIFSFSGDDDMWVFVDDVLVLDIGGLHHPSSGYIDFTNGTVHVDGNIYSSSGINKGYGNAATNASLSNIFTNAEEKWVTEGHSAHTIKIFYLERGGIYSNCKIVFNLPLILGKGTASVVKKDANPDNTVNEGKLEGAIFGLWENPTCTGDPFMTRVSGTNGMCTFDDLSVGDDLSQLTYYMKELRAPNGYLLDDTIYMLKPIPDPNTVGGYKRDAAGNYIFQLLGQNGTTIHVLEQEPHWPYIENAEATPIGLKVQKEWQDADNLTVYVDPPEGVTAQFRIKRYKSYDVIELGTDNVHRIIKSVRTLDTGFNEDDANVIDLPIAGADEPWEYIFNDLIRAEEGTETVNGRSYTVQYYYDYFIEETIPPEGYETIYLDGDNEEMFGSHGPSELATHDEDQMQTVINRELLDIPVTKRWPDFSSSEYDWEAWLQLDYRDIPLDGEDGDLTWYEYMPGDARYCKKITKANPEIQFEDVPEFIIDSNGRRYRREYSILETAYKVWKNGSVIAEYDRVNGPFPPEEYRYTPWFDHDAGEDEDYDDEIYPGAEDYYIAAQNMLEHRNIQKQIRLDIEKIWSDAQYYNDPDAKAVFQLKRYVLTEYRNYEETEFANAPRVNLTLMDGTKTVEVLTVPQGVRMSVHGYLKPGASGDLEFTPNNMSCHVENTSSGRQPFDAEFTADGDMTITLVGGEELVVGGTDGLRFKELDESSSQAEVLDNSFCIEFELNRDNHWQKVFPEPSSDDPEHPDGNTILPAVELSILDEAGNTANTYVYRYFIEEVSCYPESFSAAFTNEDGDELLGDLDNQFYFDSNINATNRPTGLEILKNEMYHSDTVLEGAEFQMRRLEVDETTKKPYKISPNGDYVGTQIITPNADATDSNGILIFRPESGLEPGYYEVKETHTPVGYVILADSTFYIEVGELGSIQLLKKDSSGSVLWDQAAEEGEMVGNASISSSLTAEDGKTITVTVRNERGAALPSTGGRGTNLIYLLGIMLTGIAGAGLMMRNRRKTI